MAFCEYCGKEIYGGKCDCQGSINSMSENVAPNNSEKSGATQKGGNKYQKPYDKTKEPFLIPRFRLDTSSFSGFISSVRDLSGTSEPLSNRYDPYEHNVPIVPDCIAAEENEIVVKQYNIAKFRTRLKFMKAECRMMVTNRRILFRATGTSLTGNIAQEHQFNLDEIGGVEVHKDYRFNILNFAGCILLGILAIMLTTFVFSNTTSGGAVAVGFILGTLGVGATFVVYKHFGLKLLGAIIGCGSYLVSYFGSNNNILFLLFFFIALIVAIVDMVILCFVPNLIIKIKTKGATGAIVIARQKFSPLQKESDDYCGFKEVMPWEDTVMAINELGTMIDDLQKHGDYAIEKWSH